MQNLTQIDPRAAMGAARRVAVVLGLASCLVLAIGAFVLCWLVVDMAGLGRSLAGVGGYSVENPEVWQSLMLTAVQLAQLCIWGGVIVSARAMFKALAVGDPSMAARVARRFAAWLWMALILGVAAQMLTSGISTWNFVEGERMVAFQLSAAQITTVLAALMAAVLAHAFALGAELWQDHREIV